MLILKLFSIVLLEKVWIWSFHLKFSTLDKLIELLCVGYFSENGKWSMEVGEVGQSSSFRHFSPQAEPRPACAQRPSRCRRLAAPPVVPTGLCPKPAISRPRPLRSWYLYVMPVVVLVNVPLWICCEHVCDIGSVICWNYVYHGL
jgi:hypothetical protein